MTNPDLIMNIGNYANFESEEPAPAAKNTEGYFQSYCPPPTIYAIPWGSFKKTAYQ